MDNAESSGRQHYSVDPISLAEDRRDAQERRQKRKRTRNADTDNGSGSDRGTHSGEEADNDDDDYRLRSRKYGMVADEEIIATEPVSQTTSERLGLGDPVGERAAQQAKALSRAAMDGDLAVAAAAAAAADPEPAEPEPEPEPESEPEPAPPPPPPEAKRVEFGPELLERFVASRLGPRRTPPPNHGLPPDRAVGPNGRVLIVPPLRSNAAPGAAPPPGAGPPPGAAAPGAAPAIPWDGAGKDGGGGGGGGAVNPLGFPEWRAVSTYGHEERPQGRQGEELLDITNDEKCLEEHDDFCFACVFHPTLNTELLENDYRAMVTFVKNQVRRWTVPMVCRLVQNHYNNTMRGLPKGLTDMKKRTLRAGVYDRPWSLNSIYAHFYLTGFEPEISDLIMQRMVQSAHMHAGRTNLYEQNSETKEKRVNAATLKQLEKGLVLVRKVARASSDRS